MYSLIISAVFIPFLWGDSNVSTQEIKGFTSLDECYGAAIEVGKTKKKVRAMVISNLQRSALKLNSQLSKKHSPPLSGLFNACKTRNSLTLATTRFYLENA